MKTKRLKEIYKDMLAKCYDPKHPEYKNVGAKGITVCKERRIDFTLLKML